MRAGIFGRVATALRDTSADRVLACHGLAPLADVADGQRCDRLPELVFGREHAVIAMPVLPRRCHKIGKPVQELKRREPGASRSMSVIRILASIENPLFSQASMSAVAAASSRRESLNHRITRRRTRSVSEARSAGVIGRAGRNTGAASHPASSAAGMKTPGAGNGD
jgi:hypothetical protein